MQSGRAPLPAKQGKHTGGIALWVLWHQLALSQSWTRQQLVRLSILRILVALRIPACPGSFLLAAVDVQHSSTPSAGTGSFLMQTRGTKHGVNGNTDQAAGSTQAGLQLHNNSQNEMYQMFQPHKEATCMSTCRNCVLPPAVLVSCKSVGKCWCFESYFPFPKLAVPQVCVAQ